MVRFAVALFAFLPVPFIGIGGTGTEGNIFPGSSEVGGRFLCCCSQLGGRECD